MQMRWPPSQRARAEVQRNRAVIYGDDDSAANRVVGVAMASLNASAAAAAADDDDDDDDDDEDAVAGSF